MTTITSYDFETNRMTHHASRTAYREAVATVAAKAHAKLPACAGRIDSAVKLVLLGEVTLLPDGTATVGSCTDPTKTYAVNGTCTCQDFERAPGQLCKHRLAYGIARRAAELVPVAPETVPEAFPDNDPEEPVAPAQAPAPAPLPEMPFSVTLKGTIDGHDALLTARGMTAAEFQANLQAIRGLLDPVQAPAQGQPSPAAAATPQCPQHGAMKPSSKGKGWYCAHKNDDDTWCKSKSK